MKTFSQIISVVVFAAVVLLFCAGHWDDQGGSAVARWDPQQDTSPLDLYIHFKHFERFNAFGVPCALCHQTPDSFNRQKVNRMGCHHCHNNPQSPSSKAARFKCTTCHKNLLQVRPENHNLSWIERHQSIAKQDKQYCYKCHKSFFCTECHQNRDFVNKRMHSRNFRYYHSIEARSNPRTCTNCHQKTFCKDCHAKSN